MSEGVSTTDIVHEVLEDGERAAPVHRNWWLEMLEAFALAVVALATAWSGFQADRWSGSSAREYSLALSTTVLAQEKATLAGQDRLYDMITFNQWLAARALDHATLAGFFERRFRPEYVPAFVAWEKLDPLNNPSVVPGPVYMPEYVEANVRASARLTAEAKERFDNAVKIRETGDQYVKVTVLLATVLLLTAIGGRFKVLTPRVILVTVALLLLAGSTYVLFTLPRA